MTEESVIPIMKARQCVQMAIGRVEVSEVLQLSSAVEKLLAARKEMDEAVAHYWLRRWAASEGETK